MLFLEVVELDFHVVELGFVLVVVLLDNGHLSFNLILNLSKFFCFGSSSFDGRSSVLTCIGVIMFAALG